MGKNDFTSKVNPMRAMRDKLEKLEANLKKLKACSKKLEGTSDSTEIVQTSKSSKEASAKVVEYPTADDIKEANCALLDVGSPEQPTQDRINIITKVVGKVTEIIDDIAKSPTQEKMKKASETIAALMFDVPTKKVEKEKAKVDKEWERMDRWDNGDRSLGMLIWRLIYGLEKFVDKVRDIFRSTEEKQARDQKFRLPTSMG